MKIALILALCAYLPSCGSGGGGGSGSRGSDNPTEHPGPDGGSPLAVLLDLEAIEPRTDVLARSGETVAFGIVLGPEHPAEGVEYSWSIDEHSTGENAPELAVNSGELAPGTHAVKVMVSQGSESGSVSWHLRVDVRQTDNRPPVILQALPPGGVTMAREARIILSVAAADADAVDELRYSWTMDDKAIPNEGPALEVDAGALRAGAHKVAVEVEDGVARATAPVLQTWTLSVLRAGGGRPSPYLSGAWPVGIPRIERIGKLRFEVDSVVPDPEDVVSYRWEVDGIVQKSTASNFHFIPDLAEDGGLTQPRRVTCRLVVGNEESGEAGPAVGWTVLPGASSALPGPPAEGANSLPAVTFTLPEKTPMVVPGETLTLRIGATDSDGDLLTYRWFVDGALQTVEGPVFTYTRISDSGENASRIAVQVSDGHGEGGSGVGPMLASWDVGRAPLGYLAITVAPDALIKDTGDPGTSFDGEWQRSEASGSYGDDSLYSKAINDTYTYEFQVPQAGDYDVLLWWTAWPSRSPAAPVKIQHAAGFANLTVDQTRNGGRWNSLGVYEFSTSGKVTITSLNTTYSTCADAVCLNPVGSSDPPEEEPDLPGQIIVDDGTAGTSFTGGGWSPSGAPNPYGSRSLYAKSSGSYTFQKSISSPGSYDVYAWWTEWPSRDADAPYDIVHANGTSTVRVDQRVNGGKWNYLGKFSFGGLLKVSVRVTGTETVCADAVRFLPAGSLPPPDPDGEGPGDIIVDNGGPGTSSDGFWSVSSAPEPYGADSIFAKDRGYYQYDIPLPASGKYGVYVWYTQTSGRESAVPYEIRHSSGTAVIAVDQRTGGGRWSPLGDFNFGSTARITVRVIDLNSVSADAVRLVPGGGSGSPPPLPPPDPAPSPSDPGLTELAAFALTPTAARVSWRTNFLGNSVVNFGTTSDADDAVRTVSGSRFEHSIILEPVSPDRTYYVRVKTDGSGTSKSSGVVSFRTPDSDPSYSIISSHPRVFLTQADISSIRSRIKTSPADGWWSAVLTFAGHQMAKSVTDLRTEDAHYNAALAFAGLIGDVESFRDKAIAVAMSVAGQSLGGDDKEIRDRVDTIIPAYDWLHAYLTASQKTTLRAELAALALVLEGKINTIEYAIGHSNGNQNGAFLAALAIHGEDSSAAGIISRGLARYQEGFLPFWREHGSENGGSFKSGWYTTVATNFNVEVFAAWKSATGQSFFQAERAWCEKLADWYLHSLRGDMSWDRHGDIVIQAGVDEVERHFLTLIAKEYKNTDAQWLAGRIRDYLPIWGPNMVRDILWHDPGVSERAPTQALSRHFRGAGMVFCRESWQDDVVKASFRATPYYMGGHNHLDQCSFAIFYKAGLALDSGVYDDYASSHWVNYYARTIAHNAILVTDPAEVFSLFGDTHVADGGQYWLDRSRVPHTYPQLIEDLTDDDGFHIGGVKGYEDTELYTYALGEGTRAYRATKLASYCRHFVWLKKLSGWNHPVILVFDEVESTKSTFKKTYLLHTQNKPAVSGGLVSATNGGGRLYQRTVFPASAEFVLIGGSGKEYWVNGKNYPPNRSPKELEDAGQWRVEISPSAARLHDEFLHALYPTESGASSPPTVRAIDAATMKGLETQGLIVLFSVKLENVPTVSYTAGGSRRHILFGLTPGRAHDVFLEGAKKLTRTATVTGILDFTLDAGGDVDVVRK